jgi:MoaA/NifB/PqqE/SkfB family radical SAM enzyme
MELNQNLPYLGVRYQVKYHKCNLDCPYCIARWKEQKNFFDNLTYRGVLEGLRRLPYRICLRIGVGGEAFTSPELLQGMVDICNSDSNIFGVSFSTNLVASWEGTIEPFLDSLDTGKLGMGCTLHDTVIKDIDGFFEKARKIRDKGVLLYIGLVAIPGRIHMIREYRERCLDMRIPLIMNGLVGKLVGEAATSNFREYPEAYTNGELTLLKALWDTPHSYMMQLEACSTMGMVCSAGKNYLYINASGDVFPCSRIRNKIGNILTDQIVLQADDTICPVSSCWCGNENQALRLVDRYYDRTRTLRIFNKKSEILEEDLYTRYNPSIFNRKN